jgi:uncharacterized protein
VSDAYDSPAPVPDRSAPPPLSPSGPPQPPLPGAGQAEPAERRLTASTGLFGFGLAVLATFMIAVIAGLIFGVGDDTSDDHGFQFVATFGGDVALVLVAYLMAASVGRVTVGTFGFRPIPSSAIGWVFVAFVTYLVLAGVYTVLFEPPAEDLPEQLGADESTLLAVVTGLFVVVIAPFVEEFFFRGFLYQALRNSWGTIAGVLASSAIFSIVHSDLSKFVPLFILGIALALLFERTRSLWPCIMLHAINNALAFAVSF